MIATIHRAAPAALLALLLAAPPAAALPPDTRDAKAVMKAVDARPTGDKGVFRLKMVIRDAAGSKRERAVRSRSMKFPGGTKQLLIFESPPDVRNTALLTVDHDDGSKVDDQWLYLPSLKKATRISSSDRSGPFMGSDLSFADMTGQDPDQYDYKMVKPATRVRGEPCWLVEARPRTKKAREETGYLKSLIWVSKKSLMPLQMKHWVRKGQKIKLMKFDRIKKVNGVWFAHRIMARTLQGRKPLSTTIITFSRVRFGDPSVTAKDFTQRRLEQGL